MQRLDKLNLAQKHWTRNPKESRKTKEVKFAAEAIEMNETVKNRFQGRKNYKSQEQVEGCNNCKDQERVEG